MLRLSLKPIKDQNTFGLDEKGGFTLYTTAQLKSLDNHAQQKIS